MTTTLLAPLAAHAFARPSRTSQRKTGVFRRWLASWVAARERAAAELAVRRLVGRIPHTSDADRTRLEILADTLRRSLR
jgi:hypothetical protein